MTPGNSPTTEIELQNLVDAQRAKIAELESLICEALNHISSLAYEERAPRELWELQDRMEKAIMG